MCGILGIAGDHDVISRLFDGLARLEYRGYDSSGMAVIQGHSIVRKRAVGKLKKLPLIEGEALTGIGHTRWATHGGITEENSHPHGNKNFMLVHNGIIENHDNLRQQFDLKNFQTQTDTEVIVHLIQRELDLWSEDENKDMYLSVLQKVMSLLKGRFAVVVMFENLPNSLFAMRQGSPLVIGKTESETFVGSDVLALSCFATEFCYLENGDVALLKPNGFSIFDEKGSQVERPLKIIHMPQYVKDRGEFEHYMLKEIFEQPLTVQKTLDSLKNKIPDLSKFQEIRIIACGTSFYAAMIAKYWFEYFLHVKTFVELASEFRYSHPILSQNTCVIFISQSGETIDTLSCLPLVKSYGAYTVGIINVRESSIARAVDYVLYTEAGLEVGVASTKAFTAQLAVLSLLAKANLGSLSLCVDFDLTHIAQRISQASSVLFLGRGVSYPLALEGALKLKEISYIHAEGYAAGEIKHGPIALIDETVPVVCIAPYDAWFEKTLSNVQEVLARGAHVILFTDEEGSKHISHERVTFVVLPLSTMSTSPFLYAIPLQLLAYHVALQKGTDIDQPRNLAKSVTVE